MGEIIHPQYLEFIRLFNAGKFFEAHEVLELLWRAEKGESRNFYHGLIQIAAVFVHLQKQTPAGAQRLLETARGYLAPYGPFYAGLDVAAILAQTQSAVSVGPIHQLPLLKFKSI